MAGTRRPSQTAQALLSVRGSRCELTDDDAECGRGASQRSGLGECPGPLLLEPLREVGGPGVRIRGAEQIASDIGALVALGADEVVPDPNPDSPRPRDFARERQDLAAIKSAHQARAGLAAGTTA